MTGIVSRDVRTEQAIAWGRSPAWILAHIGGDQADIDRAVARMNAAVADDFDCFGDLEDPADYGIEVDDTPFDRWTCGNHAAFERHRLAGEPVDLYCRNAERRYQRDRHVRRRTRQIWGAA